MGPKDEILKLLPPLVIDDVEIEKGLDILEDALEQTVVAAATRRSAVLS